jgi:predicted RNA binding protein YcfA (HicA-like mRNA interferase family)
MPRSRPAGPQDSPDANRPAGKPGDSQGVRRSWWKLSEVEPATASGQNASKSFDQECRGRAMAKLLNQKKAIKLLKTHGWEQSVGGKHSVKMVKEGSRPITLPMCKGEDYSRSLTSRILDLAGIEDF